MSWNAGAEKAPLSFLLPGIVDSHVVIENDEQEERHAQHVGEDGELHVRDHADQLGSVPMRSGVYLEVRNLLYQFIKPPFCILLSCAFFFFFGFYYICIDLVFCLCHPPECMLCERATLSCFLIHDSQESPSMQQMFSKCSLSDGYIQE